MLFLVSFFPRHPELENDRIKKLPSVSLHTFSISRVGGPSSVSLAKATRAWPAEESKLMGYLLKP